MNYKLLNYLILVRFVGGAFDVESEMWEVVRGKISDLKNLLGKAEINQTETYQLWCSTAYLEILYWKTEYLLNKIEEFIKKVEKSKGRELRNYLDTKQEYKNFLILNENLRFCLNMHRKKINFTSIFNSVFIFNLQKEWDELIMRRENFEENTYSLFLEKKKKFSETSLYNKIQFITWLRLESFFLEKSFYHVGFLWSFKRFPIVDVSRWNNLEGIPILRNIVFSIGIPILRNIVFSILKKELIIQSLKTLEEKMIEELLQSDESQTSTHHNNYCNKWRDISKTNKSLSDWRRLALPMSFFAIFFFFLFVFSYLTKRNNKTKKGFIIKEK